ncbi:hypothetical protein [Klebsiella oxytoca]|uniref:hypothetical protein n=1 Tax=Klebsiella oxytoca TaxID=571 RepID=UPI00292E4F3E|nr:hypothetical protein [Klebsiella oxytoca]
MTITLQAVNELIQSLESAGELSIQEQKYLALAKAYQQLAAENVQIKAMNDCLSEELRGYESDGAFEGPKMHLLWWQVETPATDRIVAEIKADEEKAVLNDLLRHLDKIDIENLSSPWELSSEVVAFVNSRLLREGADK